MSHLALIIPVLLATLSSPAFAFEMSGASDVLAATFSSLNLSLLEDVPPGKRAGFSYGQREDFCNDSGILKVRSSLHVSTPPSGDDWMVTPTEDGMAVLFYTGSIDPKRPSEWGADWGLPLIAGDCSRSSFGPDAWIPVSSIESFDDNTVFYRSSEILGIAGDGTDAGDAFVLDVKQLPARQVLNIRYVAQLITEPPGTWTVPHFTLPELCVDSAGGMRVFVGNFFYPPSEAPDPGDVQISIAPDKVVSLRLNNDDSEEHRFLRSVFGAIDVPCERSPHDPDYLWVVGSINGKTKISELLDPLPPS
jgi:hypothetical protein